MDKREVIVAVHQPQFMPWLGYFDKMDRCDFFVLLDNVQYKKNEYQNRNRIKTSTGWQWITVPVNYRFPQKMNEVLVHNGLDWRKKNLHALEVNYGKARCFKRYIDDLREFYLQEWQSLSQINIACVKLLKEMLGIGARIMIASELEPLSCEPNGRLIDICARLGSGTYLAGRDGAKYMNCDMFRDASINVVFQEFRHPVYSQLFGKFEYFMSVVDLLLNCGEESLEIIRKENGR